MWNTERLGNLSTSTVYITQTNQQQMTIYNIYWNLSTHLHWEQTTGHVEESGLMFGKDCVNTELLLLKVKEKHGTSQNILSYHTLANVNMHAIRLERGMIILIHLNYFTGFLFCSDIKKPLHFKQFLDSDDRPTRFYSVCDIYSIHPKQKNVTRHQHTHKTRASSFHVKLGLTGTKNKYDVVCGFIQTAGPRRPLRSACSRALRSAPVPPNAGRSPSPSSHGAASSSPGSSWACDEGLVDILNILFLDCINIIYNIHLYNVNINIRLIFHLNCPKHSIYQGHHGCL